MCSGNRALLDKWCRRPGTLFLLFNHVPGYNPLSKSTPTHMFTTVLSPPESTNKGNWKLQEMNFRWLTDRSFNIKTTTSTTGQSGPKFSVPLLPNCPNWWFLIALVQLEFWSRYYVKKSRGVQTNACSLGIIGFFWIRHNDERRIFFTEQSLVIAWNHATRKLRGHEAILYW
jgi:hypothetical protein